MRLVDASVGDERHGELTELEGLRRPVGEALEARARAGRTAGR